MSEEIVKKIKAQLGEPDRNGLYFTNKRVEVTLPTGIKANMAAQCEKQCSPRESDKVTVRACIGLPTVTDGRKYLAEELQFYSRIDICGEGLTDGWGTFKNGFRVRGCHFADNSWLIALKNAENKIIDELAKLWVALETRLAYLHSEGEEYYLAKKLLPEEE